jgi:hypothetical protein
MKLEIRLVSTTSAPFHRECGRTGFEAPIDTEDLVVDTDGHQNSDIADLAAPATLQPDSIKEDIGMLPMYGPISPLLDQVVDLLIQLSDGAGADADAPEGLGDVLNAAGGNS